MFRNTRSANRLYRRQIEKSPLAQIEMSLSPVFDSDGEVAADDGDFDEPFGDRSDDCSAGSGGGSDQGFGGSDVDGAWASPGVPIGKGISAAWPRCAGVAHAGIRAIAPIRRFCERR